MWIIFLSLIVACIVLLALNIGGSIGAVIHTSFSNQIERLNVFCGGLLVGLLVLKIVPESLGEYPFGGLLIGVIIAIIFMKIVDRVFSKHINQSQNKVVDRIFALIFLIIAISIHNIPTGVALGVSSVDQSLNSSPLLAALFLHHIPEGITLLIATFVAGFNFKSFFIGCLLLSVILGSSMLMGSLFAWKSIKVHAILMGSAIGTISYVSGYEMLWKIRGKLQMKLFFWYIFLGIGLIYLYFNLLD